MAKSVITIPATKSKYTAISKARQRRCPARKNGRSQHTPASAQTTRNSKAAMKRRWTTTPPTSKAGMIGSSFPCMRTKE